jgi:hypothetical protein
MVVKTTVPRDGIFARSADQAEEEVFVDFERIDPEKVARLSEAGWKNDFATELFRRANLNISGMGCLVWGSGRPERLMDWSDIALPTGGPESGHFGMHLKFTLPQATCKLPATERQAEAVRQFYAHDFGEICESQAHALLSCREYARLCALALFNRYPAAVQQMMARALAAYLLCDREMVEFATKWNVRNLSRGTGSPRVKGSPHYADLEQFAEYLDGMIEMNGWTLETMKRLRH